MPDKIRGAVAGFLVLAVLALPLRAAVGCDLNDPDRDVKRLFPESTGYKTLYVSIAKSGGEALLKKIEARLGDAFKGLYETIDVPYTMYQVFKGTDLIGYIHGVNQKGRYGGIQVFLALDLEGVIRAFYFQKMTGQYAKVLRGADFGKQFVALSLPDFDKYDVAAGKAEPGSRVAAIANPVPEAEKNLILCDVFLLGNRYVK